MNRKVLYFGEVNKMLCAENILTAYRSRKQTDNWAEWTSNNPHLAELLAGAEKILEGGD